MTNQKVVLVTGASSGIGEATAERLAKAGYKVYGTSRRGTQAGKQSFDMIALDVTSDESVVAAVREVMRLEGRIDLLVNNAGFSVAPGGAEESSMEQAQSIFDVNLFGAIRMTKAVLPLMRQQRSGRIINISSVLGIIPAPFSALYASSKHAIEGYSESLDHEVRGSGIRVVLVEPAYTRTGFDTNALVADQKNDHYAPARANAEAVFRAVMTTADSPDVVADAVVTAATAATPRLRYTAGSMARKVSLLRRFVPASAFDKSLRKQLQMPA